MTEPTDRGLSRDECVALILHHIGRIGNHVGHYSGADLQEAFDRIDTFVQAVKVLEMTQPTGEKLS